MSAAGSMHGTQSCCYEAVSRKNLGLPGPEHYCSAPGAADGYRFSRAMANPGFIGIKAIRDTYLPRGFTQFKIEGRGLGSALILNFASLPDQAGISAGCP